MNSNILKFGAAAEKCMATTTFKAENIPVWGARLRFSDWTKAAIRIPSVKPPTRPRSGCTTSTGAGCQKVPESEQGEFPLASGHRHGLPLLYLGVSLQIVGRHGFFQPLHVVGLQHTARRTAVAASYLLFTSTMIMTSSPTSRLMASMAAASFLRPIPNFIFTALYPRSRKPCTPATILSGSSQKTEEP